MPLRRHGAHCTKRRARRISRLASVARTCPPTASPREAGDFGCPPAGADTPDIDYEIVPALSVSPSNDESLLPGWKGPWDQQLLLRGREEKEAPGPSAHGRDTAHRRSENKSLVPRQPCQSTEDLARRVAIDRQSYNE